ncbi:MAG: polysaccharide biosynthesis tyrosine autokinase [Psychrobacter sp.]|nr:polysaccharide biosynthesis tyrosine autokinase [Psychrobacter sp.]
MTISTSNSSNTSSNGPTEEVNILALLMVLIRGWKIIVACALLGLLSGVLYSRYMSPVYQSDALVQIDQKSQGISGLGSNISELVAPEVSPAQTERELIKSRMVLAPVVDRLHLDIGLSNSEVTTVDKIINKGATFSQVNSAQGASLMTNAGSAEIANFEVPDAYLNQAFTLSQSDKGFTLTNGTEVFNGILNQPSIFKTSFGDIKITVTSLPEQMQPVTITKYSLNTVIESLSQALNVDERGQHTGIIQLSMLGGNPQQVTGVLTEVVESYLAQNQARGSKQTSNTIEFMESQIPKLKQKLESSETAFNEFREAYGTIDISQEAELLLTERYHIDSQLNELNLQQAELSTYYTNEHPLVVQINDQLKVLKNRKQEIEQTVVRLPEIQREFMQLSEDMGINREIYLTMLKNYEQLKIVKAGEIGYVRIVDMPIAVIEPIATKKPLIWAIALLLGALLGSAAVLLRNILSGKVQDSKQLEINTGIPIVATVPRSNSIQQLSKRKRSTHRLLAHVDHDSLSYESLKGLRTLLMFGRSNHGAGKVILITSGSFGVGKSFVASNLAEIFSQLDKKVLVIDGDMRMGNLDKVFPIEQETGLTDYLSQSENEVYDYVHATNIDNVDILPRGHRTSNLSSLLAKDRFGDLIKQLSSHYDYIVIDSPPVLATSDALLLAKQADKVLMVARHNKSVEKQMNFAIDQLTKANIRIDGIVLNDVNQTQTESYKCHSHYVAAQASG